MISAPCAIAEMPAAEYHGDPCPTPSLTQSTAATMIGRSIWHGQHYHPRLGNSPRESTPDQILGSAVHAYLLGQPGPEVATKKNGKPYASMSAAGAVKIRQEAARTHRDVISAEQDRKARELAAKAKAEFDRLGIVFDGVSELSFFWEEQTPAGSIWARGRADHFAPEKGVIYDIKTTYNASPGRLDRSVVDYSYYLQAAVYIRGLGAVYPKLQGRLRFVLLFIERETGVVCPAELSAELLRIGELDWMDACEWWAEGTLHNNWPSYTLPGETNTVEAPIWWLKQKGRL